MYFLVRITLRTIGHGYQEVLRAPCGFILLGAALNIVPLRI